MKVAFLGGRNGVALGPPAEGEVAAAEALPERLRGAAPAGRHLSGSPAAGQASGVDRAIELYARDAAGRFLGRVALVDIDWVGRRAGLSARWGDDAAGAAEAMRLLVGYAGAELDVHELSAAPSGPAWEALLAGLGGRHEAGLVVVSARLKSSP